MSDNVARVERIGEDALRVVWRTPPSQSDIDEFTRFVEGVIGPINPTISRGIENEADAYSEWKRRKP